MEQTQSMINHEFIKRYKTESQGIPWQSSGQDCALSLLRGRIQSLVGALRSHKLCGAAKKKKKKIKVYKKIVKKGKIIVIMLIIRLVLTFRCFVSPIKFMSVYKAQLFTFLFSYRRKGQIQGTVDKPNSPRKSKLYTKNRRVRSVQVLTHTHHLKGNAVVDEHPWSHTMSKQKP